MRKRNMALIGAAALVSSTAVIAWFYRADIVTRFVDSALAERGVPAQYSIEHVGIGRQKLRNVIIGDPAAPDLVIDTMEISLALGLDGPRIAAVAVDGVMLRGRLSDTGLSFGAVDRLIPADDGTPFELPDMHLSVRRASVALTSPWGNIGIGASGSGELAKRFVGHVAARGDRLTVENCVAQSAIAKLQISIVDRVPGFSGPVGADQLRCRDAGLSVRDLRVGVEGALDERLEQLDLASRLRVGRLTMANASLAGLTGNLTASGAADGRMQSRWTLRAVAPNAGWASAAEVVAEGTANRRTDGHLAAQGSMRAARVRSGESLRRTAQSLRSVGTGLPVEPLLRRLSDALARAGSGASLSANLSAQSDAAGLARISVGQVRLDSRSGAFVHLSGDDVFVADSGGKARLALNGRFGGGDLPAGTIAAQSSGGGALALSGELRLAPMAAQTAELALAPIRFDADGRGGTRFTTAMRLSGPIRDGFVDRLAMRLDGRVDARGVVRLSGACQPVSWNGVRSGDASINAGAIRICGADERGLLWAGPQGVGGGARIGATRLRGQLAQQPFDIAVAGGELDIAARRFAIDGLALTLGEDAQASRLDMESIDGTFDTAGLSGRFGGLDASLRAVPLLLSDSAGNWRWADGALSLDAALTVSDRLADARFNPLVSRDASLRFANGRIGVAASLIEPTSGTVVARVAIDHIIDGQRGEARLTTDGIRFHPDGIQPVTLSRLGLGVIADTDGVVRGDGLVRWANGDVSSTGRFTTDNLDFAAAFGPVRGLRGTLQFSDLLGLTSPPSQRFEVASINPGIEVTDGVIDLQLLADRQVRVESGRWPFAGGILALRPTTLDFDVTRARQLTFDLDGVDAALFLARFEFDNINASGIFDGTVPTVFDASGGRIVGGEIRSRAGGGLSYLGELTYRDLGYFGNLAFRSLRSIRYDSLAIRLDGDIDGDMVTEVDFAGLAQGDGVENNVLTRAIRSLPVIFRIRMNAPFRSLLTSARSLYDPTLLIEQNLPALLRAQRERDAADAAERDSAVQPGVSDDD